jgi:hypothetical protein
MKSLSVRRRRIGVISCVLSGLGLPCAGLAVWGVRTCAKAGGEWAMVAWLIGGFAVLVGAPGAVLAIQRLRLGLALLRDGPDVLVRAKRLVEATLAAHLVVWAIVVWLASHFSRSDLSPQIFAVLFGGLAISGVTIGHAMAARSFARGAEAEAGATSSPPSRPSARPL